VRKLAFDECANFFMERNGNQFYCLGRLLSDSRCVFASKEAV
jgi:hypothetical protein